MRLLRNKSYDCVDTDHQILIDLVIQEKSPEMDSFWKDVKNLVSKEIIGTEM